MVTERAQAEPMTTTTERTAITYEVGHRNGYAAVDEYHAGRCQRTVIAGITNKLATTIAAALTDAYRAGVDAR